MKKSCQGTIYVIDGKEWCVGEKLMSKKWGTRKPKRKPCSRTRRYVMNGKKVKAIKGVKNIN